MHRGWSWQRQQKHIALNRSFKGDFNCIYHQNCLWYVLTLSYLLKMLSSSISSHCNIVSKLARLIFSSFACELVHFLLACAGCLSHSDIPKGMFLQSFLIWDLSVVFHLCPWITISLWLQEPRLFPASDSLSYLSSITLFS